MTEYNKMSLFKFTSTGVTETILVPYRPAKVRFVNQTAWAGVTAADVQIEEYFDGDPNDTGYVQYFGSTSSLKGGHLASGGISVVTADTPQFGAVKTIVGITGATPMVVNVTAHGYKVGDAVYIYGTTAAFEVSGIVYTVVAVGDVDHFTLDNTVSPGAAATGGFVKQVFYPDLYIPYTCTIMGITVGTTTTIRTSVNNRFVQGQQIRFTVPSAWGTVEADGLTAYITSITNEREFVCDLNSTGFTAFAFPTSAQTVAGAGIPYVAPIGDKNLGFQGPNPNYPQWMPGAFVANTRYAVVIPTAGIDNDDDALVVHATNDKCIVEMYYPDQIVQL